MDNTSRLGWLGCSYENGADTSTLLWNGNTIYHAGNLSLLTTSNWSSYCAAASHTHNYMPWNDVSSLDANSASSGWYNVYNSITNGAHTNHSSLLYITNVRTPFLILIPDSSEFYIYKRYYYSGSWSGWSKINAGYADSASSAPASDVYAWAKASSKPSYTYSEVGAAAASHTHSNYFSSNGTFGSTVDLDNTFTHGYYGYRNSSSYSGTKPSTSQYGGFVVFNPSGTNSGNYYSTQVALLPWFCRYRIYDDSKWYDWKTIITSDNIGSQSVSYATTAGSASASDVYSWAKASSKPSYDYTEITNLSSASVNYATYSGHAYGNNFYGCHINYCGDSDLNHTIYYGYSGRDRVDWNEYGGIWCFWSGSGSGAQTGTLLVQLGLTNTFTNYITAPSFYETSDIRYKNIQSYIDISTKDIANLPIFKYNWVNNTDDLIHAGTSAQAVEEILPELITTKDDFKSLNYGAFATIASITACRRIEYLETKIQELETRLSKYEK